MTNIESRRKWFTMPRRVRIQGIGLIALLLVLLIGMPIVRGQGQSDRRPITEDLFRNLEFRNIGPAIMGGRIDDIAVVESDPRIIYIATASGGVWRTSNGGITWEPIFDNEAVSSIGDVTVAPSNPNIVWVGTGEPNNRQSSSWGNGVYKSLDGGRTWQHMGLSDTHHIGRIVIDPTNPDIVYVAALGRLWGPNRERGLFKTTDGGKTWTCVLFINEDTGVVDVAMDPQSPNILYAAAYQRRRTAYGFNGGGPHSALYKSVDGGATWKKLAHGLPTGDTGRIGLDIYRRDPRIVYAIVENKNGGVFRSEDRGETWTKMSDVNPRPSYYSQIRIDPNNDQRIWVMGAPMYYSEDGGRTFRTNWVTRIHGDFHAMWINPANSDHIVLGSDGGIHISYDRGRTWDFINTLPLGQFYEICYDMRRPYFVYGGLQDNGSWMGPSRTLYTVGITNEDWIRIGGGDGFYVQVDPTNPNILYVESQNGNITRLHLDTGERRIIRPEPKPGQPRYRFDWNSPILISPHDPSTIYFGGNKLFISRDRGETWTETPDLTTQPDREKMPIMGVIPGPDTLSRHDGVETYGQITTISESPLRPGILWVGTDDGNVQVSRDGGRTWENVVGNIPGVPKNTYVSRVVASRSGEGTAYVTFDGHRSNDFTPYVYMTTDFGKTWRSLRSNLPDGHTINVIREHPRNPNLLFIGTEFGLFVSFDRGGRWIRLKNNLPTVPVDDIQIHPRENDLILGTHGRSIFILDDITPLEQLSPAVLDSDLHVFDIRPATMYRLYAHKGNTGHKFFIAPNPPYGAIIHYYLKTPLGEKEEVKITIVDREGRVVRELRGPREAGIHRVAWDLRHEPPVRAEAEPSVGPFGAPSGPLVLPGEYTVRVSAGSRQVSRTVRVEEDPRLHVSEDELRAHRDAWHRVGRLYASADVARRRVVELRTRVIEWVEGLKRQPNASPSVQAALASLLKELDELRDHFVARPRPLGFAGPDLPGTPRPIVGRLAQLYSAIGSFTARPTPRQAEMIEELAQELTQLVDRLNRIIEETIPNLNQQLRENRIPHLAPGERVVVPR
jgi:photosystem II stability/assembly factor-like uncharacterized protein